MRIRARLDDAAAQSLPRVRRHVSDRQAGARPARAGGLRAAAVPVRPARRPPAASPTPATAGAVDLSIGTPCDPPPAAVVEALGALGRRAGLPAVDRHARLPRGGGRLAGRRRFGVDVDPAQVAACVGTKELVAGAARTGCACARPTATPCSTRRSATRPTRWAPSSPAAGRCPSRRPVSTDASTRPTRRGPCACGSTRPGNPTGGLDDLGGGGRRGAATTACPCCRDECYVEFTWDGPPRTILAARHRRRARGALAVEAVEPGRGPGRLLRRRPRPRALPARGAQARRVHGARAGAGGGGRRVRRRRPRRGRSASATAGGSSCCAASLAAIGVECARAGRRVLPVGAGARRGRLGLRRPLAAEGGALVSPG